MSPSIWKPALISGVTLGVVAAIPVVGTCLNLCCCGLASIAGLVAALLFLSETPLSPETPYGGGALVGFLTGTVGSVVFVLLSTLANLIMGGLGLRPAITNLDRVFEDADMPPLLAEMLQYLLAGGEVSILWLLGSAVFWFAVYSISGTIGAVVGVAMFHKKRPPEKSFAPFPSGDPPPSVPPSRG